MRKMRKNSRILPREEDGGVAYSLDGVTWESGVKLLPDRCRSSLGPRSGLRGEFSRLGTLTGCFLALGSGLRLVGTVPSRR